MAIPPWNNRKKGNALLSSAYFPPIDYFTIIRNYSSILIEECDNYQKQSYRNRCNIFASDGILSLSIPIVKSPVHTSIRDIKIDYSYPWLQRHKRAIISAYRSSPFFDYYRDNLFFILDQKKTFLFDLNTDLLSALLEMCGVKAHLSLTKQYVRGADLDDNSDDFREIIHPKMESPIFGSCQKIKPYYQVFSDKWGFKSNLSVIDLLFNEGPNAISFLESNS
jgi:hypothetical protein